MRENRSSGTARRSVRPKPPRTGKTAKTSRKTLGNSRATSGPARSRRGTAGLTATGGSQPDKRVLHSRTDRLPQELEEQYLEGALLNDLSMKDSKAFRKEIEKICKEVF